MSANKLRFTEVSIAKIKPQEKSIDYWDLTFPGLHLRVSPKGRKTFRLFYRINGQKRNFTLGKYGEITVSQARQLAHAKSGQVADGVDVQELKKADKVKSEQNKLASLGNYIEKRYTSYKFATAKSADEILQRIETHFEFLYSLPMDQIKATQVEDWRNQRIKDGIATGTVNRDIAALKAVFSRAVEDEECSLNLNPLARIKPLKIDKHKKKRYLSDDEEKRLRETLLARDTRLREERKSGNEHRRQRGYPLYPEIKDNEYPDHITPLVLTALNTGMRRGELFNLTWNQLDFMSGHISVDGEGAKSQSSRHIPIPNELRQVLKAWKEQHPVYRRGLVFPNSKTGLPLTDIKKAWSKILNDSEIENFRFHDLRHTYASKLAMKGVPLVHIQKVLGHSDLEMTQVYAHLSKESINDVVLQAMNG